MRVYLIFFYSRCALYETVTFHGLSFKSTPCHVINLMLIYLPAIMKYSQKNNSTSKLV